jgi:hypothetical protein
MLSAAILIANLLVVPVTAVLQPRTGLTIQAGDLPIVSGSWFQYYAPGWTKGYYSSSYNDQKVTDMQSVFLGDERVKGSQKVKVSGNTVSVASDFNWDADIPALAEVCVAMLPTSIYRGSLKADGKDSRWNGAPLLGKDVEDRKLCPDAKVFEFTTAFGTVRIESDIALTLFDARGYPQDFADGKSLLWLGVSDLKLARGKPAVLNVSYRIEAKPAPEPAKPIVAASPDSGPRLTPEPKPAPLIPEPKVNQMSYERPMVLSGSYSYPAGIVRYWDKFKAAVQARYPDFKVLPKQIKVDGGVSKLNLKPGGYRIQIGDDWVSVLGEEEEGVRNGLRRLLDLTFVKDGKVMLPTGLLLDQPSLNWRGIHLFVGPNALAFQKKLWTNVLLPMGFNKVVLQCEQTAWNAIPGTRTPITMRREDLKALFDWYRSQGVEPIPLIQSLGHMEWLFANGQNLDLAFNRNLPYAIDPRKPEAQAKIGQIWDEAIELLKPKTIHFGLDEIDMRGFPHDDELVTQIWEKQLPFLAGIAKKHGVEMMLWGDMALAPKEASDAANAPSQEHAVRRRAAIPKRTLIADWHYTAKLSQTLQLWKDEGMKPVASAWYRPDNIQAFGLQALTTSSGTLQTTWAGYESNEEGMRANLIQFSAMLLAAEMSWGGGKEPLDKTGYDANTEFVRLFDAKPIRLDGSPTASVGSGPVSVVAGVPFRSLQITLQSTLKSDLEAGAASVSLPLTGSATEVAFRLSSVATAQDGLIVGEIRLDYADGTASTRTLRYGQDFRAAEDTRSIINAPAGVLRVRVEKPLKGVQILQKNSWIGLQVLGVVVIR